MQTAHVYSDEWDVEKRLAGLGISKADLIQVVHQAIAARNDAAAIHPVNAPGLLAYIHGTGALRHTLLKKGWLIDRTDNIEGTRDLRTGNKIIFQNCDHAADLDRVPQSISTKGTASERMVNKTPFLFPEMEDDVEDEVGTVWFLCVAVNDDGIVTAELSSASAIDNGMFVDFNERIFIIKKGEFDDLRDMRSDEGDDIQDFEVKISRKES